jgi:hypothetical protein
MSRTPPNHGGRLSTAEREGRVMKMHGDAASA